MKVLLLGASGFIGSAIAMRLRAERHQVTGLARNAGKARGRMPQIAWLEGDLRHMQGAQNWAETLDGMDAIINCAGALQTGLRDNVEAVQLSSMLALYEAAKAAGIAQFIQISAAGVEEAGQTGFMSSKAAADQALADSGLNHTILRPGLVIGRNCYGGSELLRAFAGIGFATPFPAKSGAIQCTALEEVCEAVSIALDNPAQAQGTFDLVEAEGHSLKQIIAHHRQWLGFPPNRFALPVPMALIRLASAGADALGWLGWRSPMRSNAIAALLHGVKGDVSQTRQLLGREPLSLPQMLNSMGHAGKADRWHSRVALLYPLALASLLLLWLGSGLLGLIKAEQAAQLLTQGGMGEGLAQLCVVGGSIADLAIAAGLLYRPMLGKALGGSLLLALAYVVGSLIWRADLWLDPIGPMLKVVPIIALTSLCLAMSEER